MLTDTEARGLLQAAADTVDVEPIAAPFAPTPRPRTWSALAAAAAVVAVVGAATLVVPRLGADDSEPAPARPTPWDSVALSDDQIPSVFGYPADAARELLESQGLEVLESTREVCGDEGRALRTKPRVGSTVPEDSTVTLVVGIPDPRAFCVSDHQRIWDFVDFAQGRAKAPTANDRVTFRVNGETTSLTEAAAEDLENWPDCPAELVTCPGNAADVVAAAASRVVERGVLFSQPTLQAESTGLSDSFTIEIPTDGVFFPQWRVRLDWGRPLASGEHVLTGVDLTWRESPATESPRVTVPALVGLTSRQAAEELGLLGLAVLQEQEATEPLECVGDVYVVAQQPPGGEQVETGSQVRLTTRPVPCAGDAADPTGVGRSFVRFSRGQGPAQAMAERVRLLLGNLEVATVVGSDLARDRAAWEMDVRSYAEASPPFSALDVLARGGPVAYSTAPHTGVSCPDALADPPTPAGATRTVVVSSPLALSCPEVFEIQLWLDDSERIVAVNLLTGSP